MGVPLLDVRGLRKWYPTHSGGLKRRGTHVQAVEDVSFTLASHEVLGLAGETGSGKTTIGRSVLRLTEPTDGEILFNGENIRSYDTRRLRRFRRDAQIIFQDPFASLDPRMTIGQSIAEPLVVQRNVRGQAAQRERVKAMLEMVSLSPDYMDRMPSELSGGQRQRVVIARALVVEPQLVVADEPVSALDVSIQAQIVALLKDLKQRLGLSILFISHDLAVMEYLSDRIAVLYLGRLMEIGPSSIICSQPHHPYTRALLTAVPSLDSARRRSRIILKGDLPNPVDPPSGCVFRTRCPFAIAPCADSVPMRQLATEHWSACIRSDIPPLFGAPQAT